MKDYYLTQLRDRSSDRHSFRTATAKLSRIMASEIASQLPLQKTTVYTPEGTSPGSLFRQKIILVPILRAGCAILPAFQELFEDAPIGFIGIKRDEKTAIPHLYYENLPPLSPQDHVLLLDPMLATGGSANLALDRLKANGARNITLVNIIASRPGIQALEKHQVKIYSVAIDEHLNDKKFIIPGLGDFGDRYFGTD